jgi:hypothetical protein
MWFIIAKLAKLQAIHVLKINLHVQAMAAQQRRFEAGRAYYFDKVCEFRARARACTPEC